MFDAKYNDKDPGKYQKLILPRPQRGYDRESYDQESYDREGYDQRDSEQHSGGMLSRFTESLSEEMGNLGFSDSRSHHHHHHHHSDRYDDERSDDRGVRGSGGATRIQLTRR